MRAPDGDRAERLGDLVRAEWTKFRTITAWVVTAALVAVVTVALSLAAPPARPACAPTGGCPVVPIGPDGGPVVATFYFVHRTLAGDGTVTARVLSLSGVVPTTRSLMRGQASGNLSAELAGARPDLQPWAKAGLLVTAGLRPGAPYAAVLVTGRHGVRFQYDYAHDLAGPAVPANAGAKPRARWLRLRRTGDTVVAFASSDGTHWTRVGSARLTGLGAVVQVGLFVASPPSVRLGLNLGFAVNSSVTPTVATAAFSHVSTGGRTSATWRGDPVGANAGYPALPGRFAVRHGRFTVSGSGDIAPQVAGVVGVGHTVTRALGGTLAGVALAIVLSAAVAASEYRRGLVAATFACSPRRGRALIAKMLVIGLVAFAAGTVGGAVSLAVGVRFFEAHGILVDPAPLAADVRVVVGTGLLMALAAAGTGALSLTLRGGSGALVAGFALLILPGAAVGALPAPLGEWLLRISPAAAFAIQKVAPRYPQVAGLYTPANGYDPLGPWAGLAVLAGYTAVALVWAHIALGRRDA